MHFSCRREKIMSAVSWFAWNPCYASGRKSSVSVNFWSVCGRALPLVWRESRSHDSCSNLVCLPSWRWWLVGCSTSLQGLLRFLNYGVVYLDEPPNSSLNNFWLQSVCDWRLSIAEHRDNLTYFIQTWMKWIRPTQHWMCRVVFCSMLSTEGCTTVDGSLSCVAKGSFHLAISFYFSLIIAFLSRASSCFGWFTLGPHAAHML